jgi:NhaP-type Na+/H+ or K+/H+ antiporter
MDTLLQDLSSPSLYEVVLALMGLAFIGAAWLPRFLQGRPLSFPILYVGLGFALFSLPLGLPDPSPLQNRAFTEHFTELLVIVALMGAGLKLDRPLAFRSWGVTWRLLGVVMPLTIAATALLGWWVIGLAPVSALLLGAVLAPTDPVLASDVQVGAPGAGGEDEVRFGLTSEAGFNDGLAFPFTYLAILAASYGLAPQGWLGDWVLYYLVYKLVVGVAVGWLLGTLLMQLIFRTKVETRLAETGEGFVALAAVLLVYGVTELLQGYGFLGVFVAALALRHFEREHDYHESLHSFIEQSERLLMVIALVLFGGAIARGLFSDLSWGGAITGVAVIFLVRPAFGLLGFLGAKLPWRERFALSFFGIRGIGSFYYLAYAINQATFPGSDALWADVGFVVLLSVLVHGVSAPVAIDKLDEKRGHDDMVREEDELGRNYGRLR